MDIIVGNSQDITVISDITGVIGPKGEPGDKGSIGLTGATGTIVAVQETAPLNPSIGDLWVDTSI